MAGMSRTICCSAELEVALAPSAALALFTPEGERAWVAGWDPTFPVPGRRAGPGAVFVTAHDAESTVWITVDSDERGVRYARVVSGLNAGTVAVTVVAATPASTRLRVTYDLTALGAAGVHRLDGFAAHFDAYIAEWEAAITTHLSQVDRPR
jgi:hypothetical protein